MIISGMDTATPVITPSLLEQQWKTCTATLARSRVLRLLATPLVDQKPVNMGVLAGASFEVQLGGQTPSSSPHA